METKTVGVAVIDSDKVLLVRHLKGSNHPDDTYGLPAGRLEIGEEYVDAGVRELQEETGLSASVKDLIALPTEYHAILTRKKGEEAMVMKTFLCTKWQGNLKGSDETEPIWVDIKNINSYTLITNVKNVIEEAIRFKK